MTKESQDVDQYEFRFDDDDDEVNDEDLIPPTSPSTFGGEPSSPMTYGVTSSPSRLFTDVNEDEEDLQNEKDDNIPSSPISVFAFDPQQLLKAKPKIDPLQSAKVATLEEKTVIWGTTISVKEAKETFRNFIESFPDPHNSNNNDNNNFLYPRLIEQMKATEMWNLNVDGEYIWSFDPNFYKQLLSYPSEIIPLMEEVIKEICTEKWPEIFEPVQNEDDELTPPPKIQVRPYNLRDVKPLRELDPEDIDKLITIKGMVIRTSPIIPDMKEAFFSCLVCQFYESVTIETGKFVEPKECRHCKAKNSIQLIHNRCIFTDKQWVKLQETPDAIPEGETPHTVSMYAYNELVDVAKPGDRITITGIYRAAAIRNNSNQRTLKSLYKTYVDVIHFKREANRMLEEQQDETSGAEYIVGISDSRSDHNSVFMQERERKIRELAASPDIYEKLMRSLAPSIWELDDVKKGILCMLFGGCNKAFDERGLGRFRGEINVLLCGDPGTSKSQLLQYVHKIAPRGIYTSGKGSSAVGLTAYIARDPETREAVLESGALVLSDRGVCCIDEFDKMSDQTRSILHEVMEQQTVSIAKAGIICTLNARTSILASANPRESRYNPSLSVVENIQLPPTLLSRLDLIYLMLDKPEERTDRKLAAHLVGLYYKDPEFNKQNFIESDLLAHYISYAKKNIHPKLSDDCVNDLVQGYVQMRKLGGNKKTITATPRQLESLIRLSEAHARMRLSQVVERVDVSEALRLIRSALQQAAMDPRTGTIDMDLITTGKSATSRTRLAQLVLELKSLISQKVPAMGTIKTDQIAKAMSEQSTVEIPIAELKEALRMLAEEEFISLTVERNPTIRRIN